MYIAFKWLVGLSLAMWITMCFFDNFKHKNGRYSCISDMSKPYLKSQSRTRNKTLQYNNWHQNFEDTRNNFGDKHDSILLHYVVFAAGALVVSIFHKKNEIILFTKDKVTKINFCGIRRAIVKQYHHLKIMAPKIGVACQTKLKLLLRMIIKMVWNNLVVFYSQKLLKTIKTKQIISQRVENKLDANIILLTKQFVRKENAQPSAAIYDFERTQESARATFRNELFEKVEEHHNQLWNNNNLQHLYVITRHENINLKNQLKKISQEKKDIEKTLVILINEVFCSKKSKLRHLCSRFIVNTKNNILNSDVKQEINTFLEKSRDDDQASTSRDLLIQNLSSDIELYDGSEEKCEAEEYPSFSNISNDVVWTVKGRDGIIEKLYEYSLVPHYGVESVKRIREYSVYFVKDRILNRSLSQTTVEAPVPENYRNHIITIKNKKFLTGSPAFKKFLIENRRSPALME